MFTGIVEETGELRAMTGYRLTIGCRTVASDAAIGDSIAVNGVCLTVVERADDTLSFDLSLETLTRTSLSRLREGDPVNLERPLTLASRIGGHLVQGHVDGLGVVTGFDRDDADGVLLTVTPPAGLLRYVVEKGSVAVDGVSLTIASLVGDAFSVALIPHTLAVTTLGTTGIGDPVNLEVDVIARYVEAFMDGRST